MTDCRAMETMSTLSAELQALRSRIQNLENEHPMAFVVPPVSEAAIAASESEWGIRLPAEYRGVISTIASALRYRFDAEYGLVSFEDAAGNAKYLSSECGHNHLVRPFPFVPSDLEKAWDFADATEPEERRNRFLPGNADWSGVLLLFVDDNSTEYYVVLNGPFAGQVWQKVESSDGWFPVVIYHDGRRSPPTFLRWYSEVLGYYFESELPSFGEHRATWQPTLTSDVTGYAPSELGLKRFPQELLDHTQLTYLSVGGNLIRDLPESIERLANLEVLLIGNNRLRSLPSTLGNLSALRELYVLVNRLESVPASLGNLSKLQILRLERNRLSELPDELRNLQQLRLLNIGHNQFRSLPPWLAELSKLSVLDITGNPIPEPEIAALQARRPNLEIRLVDK